MMCPGGLRSLRGFAGFATSVGIRFPRRMWDERNSIARAADGVGAATATGRRSDSRPLGRRPDAGLAVPRHREV